MRQEKEFEGQMEIEDYEGENSLEYPTIIVLYKEFVSGFNGKRQMRFSTYTTSSVADAIKIRTENNGRIYEIV